MTYEDTATGSAARIGPLLKERGWTLAVAESCTGGLVGSAITDVSGSSDYFVGGVIAYANRIKRDMLGVEERTLEAHGAVSEEVARAMARGVREALAADVGLAVTGIAGPTGGTLQKPVGTVFIAVSTPLQERAEHHRWSSDRLDNKRLSVEAVLSLLEKMLSG
ncbi:MAG: CinA family protein [Chloroflexota bacterium]|nr:CinA family protein [Chloroflexota bacterium]